MKCCDLSYQNVQNLMQHPLLNVLVHRRGWFAEIYLFKIVILITMTLSIIFADAIQWAHERWTLQNAAHGMIFFSFW